MAPRLREGEGGSRERGLLDPGRKRPLPAYAQRIAVITSPDAAALKDIVAVVERRWPLAELLVIATRVQGDGADAEICRALAALDRIAGLDVAIVFSVLGAIVGEFVGAQRGLGNLILQFNMTLDIAGVFAVLIMLSLMGVALHLIMQAIQRRIIFWSEPDDVISA